MPSMSIPSDLDKNLGNFLLKYADRDFLIKALVCEEEARSQGCSVKQATPYAQVLGRLGLADLRALAYEIAASNQIPSEMGRTQSIRIDRNGSYQVTQAQASLAKITHTVQSLASSLPDGDPKAISAYKISALLSGDSIPVTRGDKHHVSRQGSVFVLSGDPLPGANRHLKLLSGQYEQYKATSIASKHSDRDSTLEMGRA